MRVKDGTEHTFHCDKDYFRDVVRSAHYLRIQEGHTDLVFHVTNGERVLAHKVMFVQQSKFLCSLFNISAEKQSPSAVTEISLPGFSKTCVNKLLQFLYQGQTTLPNAEDKEQLFCLAETLCITLDLEKEPETSEVDKEVRKDEEVKSSRKKAKKKTESKNQEAKELEDSKEPSEISPPSEPEELACILESAVLELTGAAYDRACAAAGRDKSHVKLNNCLKDKSEDVLKYLPDNVDSFKADACVPKIVPNPLFHEEEQNTLEVNSEEVTPVTPVSEEKQRRGRKRRNEANGSASKPNAKKVSTAETTDEPSPIKESKHEPQPREESITVDDGGKTETIPTKKTAVKQNKRKPSNMVDEDLHLQDKEGKVEDETAPTEKSITLDDNGKTETNSTKKIALKQNKRKSSNRVDEDSHLQNKEERVQDVAVPKEESIKVDDAGKTEINTTKKTSLKQNKRKSSCRVEENREDVAATSLMSAKKNSRAASKSSTLDEVVPEVKEIKENSNQEDNKVAESLDCKVGVSNDLDPADDPPAANGDNPEDSDEEMDENYEVEKIMDKKGKGKNIKYLVKWKGWDAEEDFTWEPLKNLSNAKELIEEFERSKSAIGNVTLSPTNEKKGTKRGNKVQTSKETSKPDKDKSELTSPSEKESKEESSANPSMCKFCMRIFLSNKSLANHHWSEHSDAMKKEMSDSAEVSPPKKGKEKITCFKCSKEYKKKEDLKNHILDHFKSELSESLPMKKPFACPTCKKTMATQVKVLRHFAFDHQEILKYCTEVQLNGSTEEEEAKCSNTDSSPFKVRSPSPFKKMDITFSDSEDENTSKLQEKLKNVTKTFDDLFGPDISTEKESKVVYNKDSDDSDNEGNVDELLESDPERSAL